MLKRFLSLQVTGENDWRKKRNTLRQFMLDAEAPSLAALAAGLNVLKETDLRKLLPRIEQPTLVIHGECDSVVPAAASAFLASRLPNSRLRVFSGCGHAPFLSRQFVAELSAFLDG